MELDEEKLMKQMAYGGIQFLGNTEQRLRELAMVEAGKLQNDNLNQLLGRADAIYEWMTRRNVLEVKAPH